eukprot:TRINITY_DN33896_c0_g1_i1.p1 TRINITY_DN33896_c0_g1~~TRINITY_DN33896_c0_g1_i1.p1  ORF type:complete len:392 (+),score=93.07 TRINITY_DN33896_c0_g1_i1:63-1178(+)
MASPHLEQFEDVDVEQHSLVDEEPVSQSGWPFTRTHALAVSLVLAAVLATATVLRQTRTDLTRAVVSDSSVLEGESFCGALKENFGITKNAKDFSSLAKMRENGWMFHHVGGCDADYHWHADIHNPQGRHIPISKDAYYGWCWPGEEKLSLTMKGYGTITLSVSNANAGSNKDARVGGEVLVSLGGVQQFVVTSGVTITKDLPFSEGQLLLIEEVRDAIMVVNGIDFKCGAATAASAPAVAAVPDRSSLWGSNTYINDMEFTHIGNDDWDANLCAAESDGETGNHWGQDGNALAISDRTWCATVCQLDGEKCAGILYPLVANTKCQILTKECGDKQRIAAMNFKRGEWDYLALKKMHPDKADIPKIVAKSE